MSNAKLDKVIYYIGDDSEKITAQMLKTNLANRQQLNGDDIPVVEFGAKNQPVPKELILLAHSDDTQTTIGDKTPKELAQELSKQFKGKDKTQLKSIKLVSCEGGYGDRPLALQLAEELYQEGFVRAEVQSATHPQGSKIGGVVSVTTQAGMSFLQGNKEGKLSAVMYGNQKTADFIRYKELHRICIHKMRNPQSWTVELEQERDALILKHSNFIGFDANHPDYCVIKLAEDIDDLDAPYNCYTPHGVKNKAKLSIDAAIALDFLRDKRSSFEINHPENKIAIVFINRVVDDIINTPSIKRANPNNFEQKARSK